VYQHELHGEFFVMVVGSKDGVPPYFTTDKGYFCSLSHCIKKTRSLKFGIVV
jgi:hypothetical protein